MTRVDKLSSWLVELGFARYTRAFTDNEVDLDTLPLLSE
jgi:hypothetical protein